MDAKDTIQPQIAKLQLFAYVVERKCDSCQSENVVNGEVDNDEDAFFSCLDCGKTTPELRRDESGNILNKLQQVVEYEAK